MSDHSQMEGPGEEPRKLVVETDANPVVRTLDLERVENNMNIRVTAVDTRQKIGFAAIFAIGAANWLGIKPSVDVKAVPPAIVIELIHRIF